MTLKRAFYPISTFDDISVAGVTDWRDVDVSALVPDVASGVILHAYVTSINYAVRPKGSTDSHGRTSNSNHTQRWSIVGLNAGKVFESYGGTSGPTLNLIGYTHRDYVKFFTDAQALTLTKSGVWETADLSASCPGAIGVILETLVNSSPDSIGFRAYGSTYTNINLSSGHDCETIVLPCDSSQLIQVYRIKSDTQVWVKGYITGGIQFNKNPVDVTPDSITDWALMPVSPHYHMVVCDIQTAILRAGLERSDRNTYFYMSSFGSGIAAVQGGAVNVRREDAVTKIYLVAGIIPNGKAKALSRSI